MPDPTPLTPDTIQRLAGEISQLPIEEDESQMVRDLIASLATDMGAMRRMDVGVSEPAAIYLAAEGER